MSSVHSGRLLCYNCFREKPDEGPCPYCGFDLAENEKKFPVALRAGTVLNNRYIVGRVLNSPRLYGQYKKAPGRKYRVLVGEASRQRRLSSL